MHLSPGSWLWRLGDRHAERRNYGLPSVPRSPICSTGTPPRSINYFFCPHKLLSMTAPCGLHRIEMSSCEHPGELLRYRGLFGPIERPVASPGANLGAWGTSAARPPIERAAATAAWIRPSRCGCRGAVATGRRPDGQPANRDDGNDASIMIGHVLLHISYLVTLSRARSRLLARSLGSLFARVPFRGSCSGSILVAHNAAAILTAEARLAPSRRRTRLAVVTLANASDPGLHRKP